MTRKPQSQTTKQTTWDESFEFCILWFLFEKQTYKFPISSFPISNYPKHLAYLKCPKFVIDNRLAFLPANWDGKCFTYHENRKGFIDRFTDRFIPHFSIISRRNAALVLFSAFKTESNIFNEPVLLYCFDQSFCLFPYWKNNQTCGEEILYRQSILKDELGNNGSLLPPTYLIRHWSLFLRPSSPTDPFWKTQTCVIVNTVTWRVLFCPLKGTYTFGNHSKMFLSFKIV